MISSGLEGVWYKALRVSFTFTSQYCITERRDICQFFYLLSLAKFYPQNFPYVNAYAATVTVLMK